MPAVDPSPSWPLVRLDHVLREVLRPVRVHPEEVYREIGVRSHGRGIFHKEPLRGVELGNKSVFWIKPGDLVFNIVFAWERAVAVAGPEEEGFIGSHRFPTFRPIGDAVDLRFLMRFFSTDVGRTLLELNSPGAAGRNKTLNRHALIKEKIPLPPLPVQRAIADFLDRKTAAIDALIAKKQRLIQLLEEKRQALITQAVTKGLDPNVPMKDSGSDWYETIPTQWRPGRLKNCVWKVADGPHFSPPYVDPGDGYMFISARNVKVNGWSLDDAKYISEGLFQEFCRRIVPERGDVLYTKGGTTGIARAVDFDRPFQVWVHVAVLKVVRAKVIPEYLAYALNSAFCYSQSQLHTRGATNQDLGLTRMINIELPVPPIDQQEAIVAWLDKQTGTVDQLAAKAEDSVRLLREYRQALITEAVTGKLDISQREDS